MTTIHGYAATAPKAPLQPFSFEAPELPDDEVEVAVDYCGVCHSDLSMIDSEWGPAPYPFIPGHEAVGRIVAKGAQVPTLALGQTVGVGWFSRSCNVCVNCGNADYNLCPSNQATIVGRHGGFADRVRCHWRWASPLPAALDIASAGPLFCGGITVFSPIVEFGIKPTDRVAVIGIGGLGHLAVQFLRAWGCEVTAFTSSERKISGALALGAHAAYASNDAEVIKKLRGAFDFIMVTVNVPMDWTAWLSTLKPRGRLHFVGAVAEPVSVPVFALMGGQKSISSSPLGPPRTVAKMLDFCTLHQIAPQTEQFALTDVNAALDHLRAGKANYRIVLKVS